MRAFSQIAESTVSLLPDDDVILKCANAKKLQFDKKTKNYVLLCFYKDGPLSTIYDSVLQAKISESFRESTILKVDTLQIQMLL